MATTVWASASLTPPSGNWSDPSKWSLGTAPATGDQIFMGNIAQSVALTVTEDATVTIGSLTMVGNNKAHHSSTLLLTQPSVLTVSGPIIFDADSIISGTGTLVANGAISGAGTIFSSTGLLDITGTGSIANGVVLDFATTSTVATTLKLDLSGGVTSALNIKMNTALQTLEVGPSTNLTVL